MQQFRDFLMQAVGVVLFHGILRYNFECEYIF